MGQVTKEFAQIGYKRTKDSKELYPLTVHEQNQLFYSFVTSEKRIRELEARVAELQVHKDRCDAIGRAIVIGDLHATFSDGKFSIGIRDDRTGAETTCCAPTLLEAADLAHAKLMQWDADKAGAR